VWIIFPPHSRFDSVRNHRSAFTVPTSVNNRRSKLVFLLLSSFLLLSGKASPRKTSIVECEQRTPPSFPVEFLLSFERADFVFWNLFPPPPSYTTLFVFSLRCAPPWLLRSSISFPASWIRASSFFPFKRRPLLRVMASGTKPLF